MSQLLEQRRRKLALEGDVVHRDDAGRLARVLIRFAVAQIGGHQAGLPVMQMDQVRLQNFPRQMDDGFGKENEPLVVVGIADTARLKIW